MVLRTGKIIIVFTLILLYHAYGDDGGVDISGGTAKLLDEHANISLVKQHVLIETLDYPELYKVTAIFTFYNNGESTTVAVGFPAEGSGKLNRKFKTFKTWVNDKLVETTDYPVREFDHDQTYEYFKVKKVFFPSKRMTTTKVEYQSSYGSSSDQSSWVSYLYGTGGSWKGKIGKAIFDIRFSEKYWIWSNFHHRENEKNVSIIDRNRGQIIYEMNEIEPLLNARFRFHIQQLGRITFLMGHNYAHIRPWDHWFLGHRWSTREFKGNKLKTLSLLQLKILKNEIFARHGRKFKSIAIQEYFNKMSWYKPNANFSEKCLTELDKKNIQTILKKEKEIRDSNITENKF